MKRWARAMSLAFLLAAGQAAGNPVVSLPLDDVGVTQVPTHRSIAVFIEFPEPISDYAGRGFTEDSAVVQGDFLLRWGLNDPYLVVAPLVEGARALLHVVVAGHSYALEFLPSAREEAWAKVIFGRTVAASPGSNPPQSRPLKAWRGTRNRDLPAADDPAGWISLVEVLRSLLRLDPAQLEAVLKSDPDLTLRREPWSQSLGTCRYLGRAAIRSDSMDTIVLAGTLVNPGDRAVGFLGGSLVVRCGERLFPAVITDWPAWLGPGERAEVLVAIAGDGLGGRNRLSVVNDFRISLAETDVMTPLPGAAP